MWESSEELDLHMAVLTHILTRAAGADVSVLGWAAQINHAWTLWNDGLCEAKLVFMNLPRVLQFSWAIWCCMVYCPSFSFHDFTVQFHFSHLRWVRVPWRLNGGRIFNFQYVHELNVMKVYIGNCWIGYSNTFRKECKTSQINLLIRNHFFTIQMIWHCTTFRANVLCLKPFHLCHSPNVNNPNSDTNGVLWLSICIPSTTISRSESILKLHDH